MLFKAALPEEKRGLPKTRHLEPARERKKCRDYARRAIRPDRNSQQNYYGAPYRGIPRTLDMLLKKLTVWCKANPDASSEEESTLWDKDSSDEIDAKDARLAA